MYPLEHPVLLSEKSKLDTLDPFPDELCATVDTGCQRMAIGADTLQKLNKRLPETLKAGLVKETHRFRSVHGSSMTNYVAMIPTSLGKKGSILKPAVFDTEESRRAPFLLSLPFLLHCKAVLHLDPSQGLRIHFKQYGFTVPCHLGPSGALRVPLACFLKNQLEHLRVAFEQFAKYEGKEFEVLRMESVFGSNEPSAPLAEKPSRDVCHGHVDELQASKARTCQPAVHAADDVATADAQGALHGDPSFRDGHQVDQGQGRTVQCVAGQHATSTEASRDSGGSGRDYGGIGDRDGKCDHVSMFPCRSSPISGRSAGYGQPATMPTSTSMSSLDSSKAGSQSGTHVLEVPHAKGPAVQMLHVDGISAHMDRGEGEEVQPTSTEDIKPGIYNADGEQLECAIEASLSTSPDNQGRIERLCGEGEVQGLWPTSGGDNEANQPGTSGVESSNNSVGQESIRVPGEEDGDECPRLDQRADGGVRGVQAVPGIPTTTTSSGWSCGSQPPIERMRQELVKLEVHSSKMIKQGEKVCKQAESALKRAESMWTEIMSLIRTADSTGESGLHEFQDRVLDDSGRIKNQKELTKYAQILHLGEKQARKVAELYNPNRFGPETNKFGLLAGQAFDLELGHDVLKSETQVEIRNYLKRVKPGLLVVSPRCTHFSVMQNMNLGRKTPEAMRKYLQELRKSKVLLRFAVEMILIVLEYGGVFVFEQPLTSKAWQDRWMARLFERDDVLLVKVTNACTA